MGSDNEAKPGKEGGGGALRLRRGVETQGVGGDMRKRLILVLAETMDVDYAERSYPALSKEKVGRPVSTDSRPPVLRLRGGASVSVQEAVAALVSGTAPAAPVPAPAQAPTPGAASPLAPLAPLVQPTGRPMMNQKSVAAGSRPPTAETATPLPAGEPPAVRRKLEVRTGSVPAPAPSGSAPAFAGGPSVATRAPLLPLPIDAALGGNVPAVMIPMPTATAAAAKGSGPKVAAGGKKNSPVGFGAVLVSLLLVLFLGGLFWMQRGGEEGPKPVETVVSENVSPAPAAGDAVAGAGQPETVPAVKYVSAVEIGKLATVSGTVAWEMADAGWTGANLVSDAAAAEVAAPVASVPSVASVAPVAAGAEPRPAGGQAKAPVKGATVAKEATATEPRRPEPSKAFEVFVGSLKVSGVLRQTPVRAIIDGETVFAGDVLETGQGIRLVGADFEQRQLIFEDKTRAQVKVFY